MSTCTRCRFWDRHSATSRIGDCRHPARTEARCKRVLFNGTVAHLLVGGPEMRVHDACEHDTHPRSAWVDI